MIDTHPWLASLSNHVSPRDLALLERAAVTLQSNVLQPQPGQTLPWAPHPGIIPSPAGYRGVWNWDAAFHAVGVSRWDPELAREQVRILLEAQLPFGALPDVIFEEGNVVTAFGKPPVMPWALEQVDRRAPDDAFLAWAYPRFVAYERHWHASRQAGDLFHYDSADEDPDLRDKNAALESGWDNSVRWDQGARRWWAVDLNSYMVLLYRAMAYFAGRLGRPGEQAAYQAQAERQAERLDALLYDPSRGCYADRDFTTLEFSPVLSPASFVPLYVGAAPAERAASMARLAADPAKFHPGLPTVAYDDPAYASTGYWRGPCWLNTAYFAAKGLKDCGFTALAEDFRGTILGWAARDPDFLFEYYDTRSGQGLGARQFGWSAAFVIEFILNW